ncbi:hypothetical protein EPR50_G00242880 [Perca flavescens]|uniref:Uncharacterized protein n=1 Tax=Perca flavescens TaxID=8167 RepID=A0A484BYG8_PERFV|nr:hypothetical protein EPR50_G00242880 [Perca flavescens]
MWLDPRIVKPHPRAYKSLDLNQNHMDRGSGTEASEAVLTLHDSLLRFSMLLIRLTHTKSNAALRVCSAPRRVQVNTAAATESNHSRCRARFFMEFFLTCFEGQRLMVQSTSNMIRSSVFILSCTYVFVQTLNKVMALNIAPLPV